MTMATVDVRIDATTGAVWEVLSDGWTYTNWVVGASHTRAVDATFPAVGSKIYHASGVWPLMTRDETEVQEVEAPRRLVLEARGRPLGSAKVELTLSEDAGGCRVTMTETPETGLGHLLRNPAGDALIYRRNVESLARLAALCERRTQPIED
jgi:uncharacterized protein YndB with AHSA1/START domain